ncbi:hypothetical protein C8J57DRAFT_63952 [Mycena rebaudengoi]|nr:hypothetical protein C8J57DRAFT_63952 [Mycena rebaudengoi]
MENASFQLNLLPPQSHALALCIIAFSSLASFDEAVLGPGPRPESFLDTQFFLSDTDVRSCGVRRARVVRALHSQALKAALAARVMLEVSEENTASCFILSFLEQYEFCGPTRPWGSAFYSHLRGIASTWRASGTKHNVNYWGGFLMAEALIATKHRKPMVITKHDHILICGPEPCSLQALLASLEKSPRRQNGSVLFPSMRPYIFHITCLARQLHETITGDPARLYPLSEGAVLDLMGSLSVVQTILSLLFEQIDAVVLDYLTSTSIVSNGVTARRCGFAIALSFTSILLPFYRELERRINAPDVVADQNTLGRLLLLRNQARDMARLGARHLAKGIGYLPPLTHHTHTHWLHLAAWAEFCLDEAEVSPPCPPRTSMRSK